MPPKWMQQSSIQLCFKPFKAHGQAPQHQIASKFRFSHKSMSHQIQSQQAKPELYKTANVASTATRTQSSLVMSSGNMADHYTHLFRLIWCSHGTPGRGRVPGKSLRGHHTSGQHLVHCNYCNCIKWFNWIQLDSIGFNWIQYAIQYYVVFIGIQLYSMIFPKLCCMYMYSLWDCRATWSVLLRSKCSPERNVSAQALPHQHDFAHRVTWRVHSWKHSEVEQTQEPTRRTCPSCVVAASASSSSVAWSSTTEFTNLKPCKKS